MRTFEPRLWSIVSSFTPPLESSILYLDEIDRKDYRWTAMTTKELSVNNEEKHLTIYFSWL